MKIEIIAFILEIVDHKKI